MTPRDRLYLDYNATAPLLPAARAAMENAMTLNGNPSSVHDGGRRAHAVIEDAREAVAAMTGVKPDSVIFTSGGTEANALALAQAGERPVFFSAVEHVSVLDAARNMAAATVLPVGRDGRLSLDALRERLQTEPPGVFVSIMAANNETGIRQPVAEAAEMVRAHGGIIHCDAIQVAGREPWDIRDSGVHLASVSAHKFGGPAGTGALIVADESLAITPLMRGGGQEFSQRPGTENIIGIAGFGAAAVAAPGRFAAFAALAHSRDAMERRIMRGGVSVFGGDVGRLPNTSCIASDRHDAGTLVMALDLEGIAVSAGAACSSGRIDRSHVLEAMNAVTDNAVRVSLGWETPDDGIARFTGAWERLHSAENRSAA